MYLTIGTMLASWARENSTEPVSRAVFSSAATLFTAAITVQGVNATVNNLRLAKQDIREATAVLPSYVNNRRAA